MKVVLSGITGQDGSLMADYLLTHTDAKIYGIVRQLSVPNHLNIEHLKGNARVKLIEGDITCPHSMSGIVKTIQPDYFINFAANSFVKTSWCNPAQVFETNTMSVLHQLEAIRKESPTTRYYQAGSSEEFGDVQYCPQDEKHSLRPRSPYGASKAAARHLVKTYRESYGLYAVAGWLFNHEGVRRGAHFVTRKITQGVARLKLALEEKLHIEPIILGNLEARRDWSDAEDFVDGVWRMLNQDEYRSELKEQILSERPKGGLIIPFNVKERNTKIISPLLRDYVLSSDETHTVREFIELAFEAAKIPIIDCNPKHLPPTKDAHRINYVLRTRGIYPGDISVIEVSSEFYRPAEVDILLGNSKMARIELGWKPKSSFQDLVKKMVDYDISLVK